MARVMIFHDQEDVSNLRNEVPDRAEGDTGEPRIYIDPEATGKGRVMCLDAEMADDYIAANGEPT